ncbi:hypothetical protein [Streptomyces spectabilis]|uniref:Signal transduction histidine kinase n=1 Tax=Streptomyces spectabilis TaxID=68270 RepID=A0A7W8ERI8_STRST|nr:hypothetical protein [Streptomyces spectabilis]MBB5101053.1 signal transduction histidine kinase [Streptomyces spectabilis]MCI3900262.1 ATP-binding protein [Streptomyces spectabilis]
MRQLVTNLVENAVAHSTEAPGAFVRVSVSRNGQEDAPMAARRRPAPGGRLIVRVTLAASP